MFSDPTDYPFFISAAVGIIQLTLILHYVRRIMKHMVYHAEPKQPTSKPVS